MAHVQTTLRDNMERELDYLDEARRQAQFRACVDVPGLVVPRVHLDLCREEVLVQAFESGSPLDDVRTWSRKDRLHVARTLLETLFTSMFRAGLVHGDSHAGNYRFRHTPDGLPEVVLHDYGCAVEISDQARLALLQLILQLREGGQMDPLRSFAAMGFSLAKLDAIADSMPRLCARRRAGCAATTRRAPRSGSAGALRVPRRRARLPRLARATPCAGAKAM